MLSGNLRKMVTTTEDSALPLQKSQQLSSSIKVNYQLPIGDQQLALNELIGHPITLEYLGNIHCIHCGRKTSKSFQQGYCYPCLQDLNECDLCMIHPLRCHSQHGPCDETHWVHANCNKPHIVYLANSSGLKVGITRVTQMPTRWIDQGAVQALPIFLVSNRYQAGLVEKELSEHVNDKTNWRAMLKGSPEMLDLTAERDQLLSIAAEQMDRIMAQCPSDQIQPYPDPEVVAIDFPVQEYLTKISSFNFDKAPQVSGTLLGIKGQYLIFDQGVINIRKFGGYEVAVAT